MKKTIALILSVLFVLSLAACSASNSVDVQDVTTSDATDAPVSVTQGNDNTPEPNAFTVEFKKPNGWNAPLYVFYWSDTDNKMVIWPGKKMNKIDSDIYSYDVPQNAQYLIFTDGTNQTKDISFDGSLLQYQITSEKDSKGAYEVTDWENNPVKTKISAAAYDSFISDLVVTLDGGTKVSLGSKAQVLLDQGWNFDGDTALKTNTIMTAISCKYNGQSITICSLNDTDQEITIKEGTISTIILSLWNDDFSSLYEFAPNFELGGKINNKSTRSDIISAFGEPNRTEQLTKNIQGESLIYQDKDGCSLTFILSADGSKLGKVTLDLGK